MNCNTYSFALQEYIEDESRIRKFARGKRVGLLDTPCVRRVCLSKIEDRNAIIGSICLTEAII